MEMPLGNIIIKIRLPSPGGLTQSLDKREPSDLPCEIGKSVPGTGKSIQGVSREKRGDFSRGYWQ